MTQITRLSARENRKPKTERRRSDHFVGRETDEERARGMRSFPFLPFTYRFINSIHKIGRLSRPLPRDLSRQTRPNLSSISPWSGRRLLTLIPRLDRREGRRRGGSRKLEVGLFSYSTGPEIITCYGLRENG